MGKKSGMRCHQRGGFRSSFQIVALERRLLMCAEHLQQSHLPADLGIFPVQMDVPAGADVAAAVSMDGLAVSASLPLTALSSRPGATAKLYLDFNGDVSASWGELRPGTTPAYDQDGVATTFSDGELKSIHEIWARVAEKYSPFNVDVTTVDPGNVSNFVTARVVFGGNGAWLGSPTGGVAYVGGFYNSASNTSFVFTQNLGNGYAPYAAEAAAHESGHTFGLEHQGQWSGTTLVSEYSPGTGTAAPVMGNSFSSPRGLWWKGAPSSSYNVTQDDMAIIGGAMNRFGFRADDHGGTIDAARTLTLSSNAFAADGVIERTTDWDYFKFSSTAGSYAFDASTIADGATLDLQLGLFDSTGAQLALARTGSLGEKLTGALATAGTYYLGVASHGGYGDVGQYKLTGTVTPAVTQEPATPGPRTTTRRREVAVFSTQPVATTTTESARTQTVRDSRLRFRGGYDFGVRERVEL